MEIFVECKGQLDTIHVQAEGTLRELKEKVFERTGVEPSFQQLYYLGSRVTNEDHTLSSYNIQSESKLILQVTPGACEELVKAMRSMGTVGELVGAIKGKHQDNLALIEGIKGVEKVTRLHYTATYGVWVDDAESATSTTLKASLASSTTSLSSSSVAVAVAGPGVRGHGHGWAASFKLLESEEEVVAGMALASIPVNSDYLTEVRYSTCSETINYELCDFSDVERLNGAMLPVVKDIQEFFSEAKGVPLLKAFLHNYVVLYRVLVRLSQALQSETSRFVKLQQMVDAVNHQLLELQDAGVEFDDNFSIAGSVPGSGVLQ